ncbi:MAG: PEP-CTERM sorting domain-containing protein [Caldilineaceae bacterium]|jgi:hypothetical protein
MPLKIPSVTLLIAISANTSAALVAIDDADFGVGSLTRDTSTGLDWLDPTYTTLNPGNIDANGRSTAEILANLGAGGDFQGFRLATGLEFGDLLTSAGIAFTTGCCGAKNSANIDPIIGFQNLVGVTQSTWTGTKGLLASGEKGEVFAEDGRAFIWTYGQLDAGGHWLVRDSSVPAPMTAALLGLGLSGFIFTRRKLS